MAIYNFIDPVAADGTAGVLSTGTSFVAGSAGDVGLWNMTRYMTTGSGDAWANTDFISTSYGLASPIADIDTGDGSVNIEGDVNMYTIVPDRFQVVQQRTSGQPFATPIIRREDVWQVNYVPYTAPVKAATFNENLTDPATGDIHDIKYVCTACPTDYREFENSDFPKGNCRVGEVFNVTVGSGYTTKDGLGAAAETAINNSHFGSFVTASYSAGADDLTVTAKSEGFDFDEVSITEVGGDGTSHIPAAAKTAMVIGNGSLKKVRGMEEKSLANYGYHNRLWLKQQPDLFGATAATNSITGFDLFQIVAKVDGWKGSIDKKGREDIIANIWIDQAAASGGSETIDIAFHVTSGTSTATTYNFNGAGVAAAQGE